MGEVAGPIRPSSLPEDTKLVDGVIVIECDQILSREGTARLQAMAEYAWPGRKVVILAEGMRIGFTQERMDRFEEKLDRILSDMVRRPPSGCGPY